MRQPLQTPYGLSDARVPRYERRDDEFLVEITRWNERTIVVVFTETFAVLDRGVGDVSELIEADVGSFLDTAIAYNFDVPPVGAERPRLFQLLNVDGNPALEVVAMRVSLDSD